MPQQELNSLQAALVKCKQAFIITFCFAFCINFLMLVTPLYSLQVLDRVIGSGNTSTLLMLSVIIGSAYFIYSLLQVARSFTLIKVGEWLDNHLSPILFKHSVSSSIIQANSKGSQILRDFQTVKTFLTSTGINTLFDAPWSIIYIIIIFLIHPYLGILTLCGVVIVVGVAFFNAVATNKLIGESSEYFVKSLTQAEIAARNAETVEAMGMVKNVSKNWHHFNKMALEKQTLSGYRNEVISNTSRFIRNIMQMLVTAISAYVVVSTDSRDMTTGGMIASSIIVGRALAPFDNIIGLWKTISSALKSYNNINQSLKDKLDRENVIHTEEVQGNLVVENINYTLPLPLGVAQPAVSKYILQNVSLNVQPGEVIAIIGPSGAGKTTLAKIIVGVCKPSTGIVMLDGTDVYQWDRDDFGQHIGYLPQAIELFNGSVKQNIARMGVDIAPEEVVAAAKLAGAHEMILRLPEGYDSDIGIGGSLLSGGQRQRIGLARAFYSNPKLIILDEPNANLDEAGELALSNALLQAKSKKIAVLVISHRSSVLSVVDKVLVLQDGKIFSKS